MKTIAYLVYGSQPIYQLELTYSVLSAAHFLRQLPAGIRIVLITDSLHQRLDLPIEYITLGEDDLKRWTLGGSYNHAAKYHALLMVMDRFKGSVALIDTDTYFLAHPNRMFDRISEGRAVMHAEDGYLGEKPYWQRLLNSITAPVAGYAVTASSRMHNSGVIGLHNSARAAIEDVLPLMSELYAIEPVFNIEQYAFTAVLEQHTQLNVCPDVVRHYWGHDRRFCHAHIKSLFPSFERSRFDAHVERLPAIEQPEKPLLLKIAARLKQLQRSAGGDYRFAYLAYKCAMSSSQTAIADAWANVALDSLRESGNMESFVKKDFVFFAENSLSNHKWLAEDTRQRWKNYWSTYA